MLASCSELMLKPQMRKIFCVETVVETVSGKEKSKEIVIPRRTFSVEFFVGLFALVGLGAFGYLAINIAQMRILSTGYYEVMAEFNNVSGLELGAPVEIAGVPVGSVKNITLNSTSALVTIELKNSVHLRDDDIAAVRTKGIIGDRYLKIIPGGSEDNVAAGGRISDTESAVELEEILGKFIHSLE
jgi:phospholipid/cholesterol/gamma-HCH transport system substrate-binding protein